MSDFPPIEVTNNTAGVIELFDVYQTPLGPNQSVTPTTPVTHTSLGTVDAGATGTIKTLHSSNHIVALQTGALSDTTTASQVHFPVKVIAVQSITKNRSFTVEKADKDAMEQTWRFVRHVSANPGSVLATQFLAALDDKDQTDAVNGFFHGSKSYSLCTMSTWTSVMSWQSEFLSAWQGGYFLYDASDQIKTIRLVAVVAISVVANEISALLYLADKNGWWTKYSQHTDLTIASGIVSESVPGQGGISVNAQPVWMNAVQKGNSDGVSATTVIGPTLAGTVNGIKVLGNFHMMSTPSQDNELLAVGAWLKQNLGVGMLISAGMLYMMYSSIRSRRTPRPTRSPP